LEDIVVSPPGENELIEPMRWFETPGPFELEIGCGKGGFLLSRARHRPDVRLLGIEWAAKFYRYCADRMARWGITNVRVMRTDARTLVMRHLPPTCISILHLYHPDPWPKKRHHKRRLVQPDFVEAALRVLEPGGRWLIQSDHNEYFTSMVGVISACVELQSIPWEEAGGEPGPDWLGTNFEVKHARNGATIHRAAFVKSTKTHG